RDISRMMPQEIRRHLEVAEEIHHVHAEDREAAELVERGEAIRSVRAHRGSSCAAAGHMRNPDEPNECSSIEQRHVAEVPEARTYRSSPLFLLLFLSPAAASAAFMVLSSAFSSMGGSSFVPLSTWI